MRNLEERFQVGERIVMPGRDAGYPAHDICRDGWYGRSMSA
jgi:hypothetical protein